jgi:hypothetical protein
MGFLKFKTVSCGYLIQNTNIDLEGQKNEWRLRDRSDILSIDLNKAQTKIYFSLKNREFNFELDFNQVLDFDGITFTNNFDLFKKFCDVKNGTAINW